MQRVESEKIQAMLEASKSTTAENLPKEDNGDNTKASDDTYISIEEFQKIDLRIAVVREAALVEGADKLIQLTLDLGDEQRNVFAGIKQAYEPSDLVGKQVVLVANLRPRKMRFGVSEGMVLAAGPGGEEIFLLSPDSGAMAGMQVK